MSITPDKRRSRFGTGRNRRQPGGKKRAPREPELFTKKNLRFCNLVSFIETRRVLARL
jgi:hypothetical protein